MCLFTRNDCCCSGCLHSTTNAFRMVIHLLPSTSTPLEPEPPPPPEQCDRLMDVQRTIEVNEQCNGMSLSRCRPVIQCQPATGIFAIEMSKAAVPRNNNTIHGGGNLETPTAAEKFLILEYPTQVYFSRVHWKLTFEQLKAVLFVGFVNWSRGIGLNFLHHAKMGQTRKGFWSWLVKERGRMEK